MMGILSPLIFSFSMKPLRCSHSHTHTNTRRALDQDVKIGARASQKGSIVRNFLLNVYIYVHIFKSNFAPFLTNQSI